MKLISVQLLGPGGENCGHGQGWGDRPGPFNCSGHVFLLGKSLKTESKPASCDPYKRNK